MASFEFNPIADCVTLRIKCPKCGEEFQTDGMGVPSPIWSAETHHDSVQDEEYEQQCDNCGELFNVILYNGFYGGDGIIEVADCEVDIDNNNILEVIEDFPDDESYDYDKELFDASHQEIKQLVDAIEPLPIDVKDKLYKMLYAKAITNLETYLGDTLKKYVLGKEEYLRLFVEKYKPYKEEALPLCEIYHRLDKIKERVKQTLNELMYHNLGKLKGIYLDVLNVDLGDIKQLSSAVNIRHDIVHRNGKDKDGNERHINKCEVIEVADMVNEFIYSVDSSLPMLETGIEQLANLDVNF